MKSWFEGMHLGDGLQSVLKMQNGIEEFLTVEVVVRSYELLRKRLLSEMKVRFCSAVAFLSLSDDSLKQTDRSNRGDTKGW